MARQIFAEEQPKEEQATEKSQVQQAENQQNFIPLDGKDQVIIQADEMEKLFNEWDANGHNDLSINPTLKQRIEQYLEYQEELDPLREKMAERIWKPYRCPGEEGKKVTFEVNFKTITNTPLHNYSGSKISGVVTLADFKLILIAVENPYAKWIKGDNKIGIDLRSYVIANGGTFEYNYVFEKVIINL